MSEIEKLKEKEGFLHTFESLRPDLFFPEGWTEEERSQVAEMVRPSKIKTSMFASIPMTCASRNCPVADTCPLMKINKAPHGSPCPIEMAAVQQFMGDYIEEMRVDPKSMTEVAMVRDLVDQEIQYIRKNKILAKEHFIQENPVGLDPQGNVIVSKQLHQAVDYEDRIHKRKREILKQMNATREAKSKIGQGNLDTAQSLAAAFAKLSELDRVEEAELNKRLGLIPRDEYIEAVEAEIIEDNEIEDYEA